MKDFREFYGHLLTVKVDCGSLRSVALAVTVINIAPAWCPKLLSSWGDKEDEEQREYLLAFPSSTM